MKTSTGFGPGGATVADVELMRRVVGPDIGVKAAGGVRDYEALKSLVNAGASRVGASAGVKIVQQSKGDSPVVDVDDERRPSEVILLSGDRAMGDMTYIANHLSLNRDGWSGVNGIGPAKLAWEARTLPLC